MAERASDPEAVAGEPADHADDEERGEPGSMPTSVLLGDNDDDISGEGKVDQAASSNDAEPQATATDLPRTTSAVESGAALASQLPYPDKFHTATRLAGAPSHEGSGMDDAIRLLLYALFRQAVDGPCEDPRPSIFDPVESAKHMAYSRLGKMNSIEAMFLYVRTLEEEKPEIWDGLEQLPETPVVPLGLDQPFAVNPAGETGEISTAEVASGQDSSGQSASSTPLGKQAADATEETESAAESNGSEESAASVTKEEPVALPAKGRMPNVPRAPGALDAVLNDAIRLGRLPNKDASRSHLNSLPSDLKNIVRRMLFVDELLSNQADLGRKKREAAALRDVLNIPTAADKTTGLKVAALVDCGDIVTGVIERELADWTAAIAEELAAGPFDMIADRGAFAFKHVPLLAHLQGEWKKQMEDWEELRGLVPQQDGSGGLYSMLFSNLSG